MSKDKESRARARTWGKPRDCADKYEDDLDEAESFRDDEQQEENEDD